MYVMTSQLFLLSAPPKPKPTIGAVEVLSKTDPLPSCLLRPGVAQEVSEKAVNKNIPVVPTINQRTPGFGSNSLPNSKASSNTNSAHSCITNDSSTSAFEDCSDDCSSESTDGCESDNDMLPEPDRSSLSPGIVRIIIIFFMTLSLLIFGPWGHS